MYMILNCQVSENEMVENPLMILFGELERRDPQHPAVLQFKSFMLGAKKTLQSILDLGCGQSRICSTAVSLRK